MGFEDRKLILWTGKKHSGKTTAAARLVRAARAKGYIVAGILAPAVYRDGTLVPHNNRNCGHHRGAFRHRNSLCFRGVGDCHVGLRPPRNDKTHKIKCYEVLVGFDAVDLRSGQRAALARDNGSGGTAGRFEFLAEGLRLGNTSLSPAATASADLIVVDEFGPLELDRQGWRRSVDQLVQSCKATILLVVREELADEVERLYGNIDSIRLCVDAPESIDTVISILEEGRQHARQHNAKT